jgi:hypothetical protein
VQVTVRNVRFVEHVPWRPVVLVDEAQYGVVVVHVFTQPFAAAVAQ